MEKLVPALVARLDVDLTNFPSSLPHRSRQGHRRQGFRAQEGGALRRGHRPRRADPPRPRRGTCTSPRREPSENHHAKNRVEKFTPLTLPFRFIQVDERLNGDGTGLILGINDELLGFILLTIPAVIFSQFFYAQKDEGIAAGGEDDDSGLSL